MYKKLDNKACEEYLNKFYSVKGTIKIRDFFAYSIEYTMKNNIMSKKHIVIMSLNNIKTMKILKMTGIIIII